MLEQATPAVVLNTGSKQGITNPPGNLAYNVTKSALRTYTEGLQHELRNIEGCRVTAHLLIPGWTTTGKKEHRPGAWLPDQVIDLLLAALDRGDFYIICPDDETTLEMDRKRILWSAGDLVENRPALSRWHPDYAREFAQFCA
jgi:short-subunit dehydrogenase